MLVEKRRWESEVVAGDSRDQKEAVGCNDIDNRLDAADSEASDSD